MHEAAVAQITAPRLDLDTLDAHAELARETGLVVHLVLPSAPGILERARTLAENGLRVQADVLQNTIRVRFEP